MMIRKCFVLFSILGVLSCTSLTPLDFTVAKPHLSNFEGTYLFSDIRVKPARVEERVAPREMRGEEDWIDQPMGILAAQQWESSLVDLFRLPEETSPEVIREPVFLTVEIQRLSWSGLMGVDVTTKAKYKIINPMNGKLIYSKVVDSVGSSTSTEAFVGANRMRIALVNSVKNNLEVFATSFEQHISEMN